MNLYQKNLNKQLKLLLDKLVNISVEIMGALGAHFFYKWYNYKYII
jgi:hypothetical protein